jgi:hypothetical protein
MIIKKILTLSLLLSAICTFAQKMPPFDKLDALKAEQKASLSKLASQQIPAKALDSISDIYKDIKDSIRDEARDYADSIMYHMDNSSHLELALDMSSNQMITGRRGPAYGMVGSPSFKYQHKSGFYGSLGTDVYKLDYKQLGTKRRTGIYDTSAISKIETDVILAIGFQKTFWETWDLDASLDHTFINYGNDRNYLASTVNINNSIDFWGYITANVYYSLLFGGSSKTASYDKKYSNILSFELLHDFKIYRFLGSKVFTISPQLSSDVGNDNFTRNRIRARNANGGLSDQINAALADNFFGLLNLEGSLNMDYRIQHLDIYVDPRIAFPFNVVPLTATSAAPYRRNQTSQPLFYINVGIKYLFRPWKEKN